MEVQSGSIYKIDLKGETVVHLSLLSATPCVITESLCMFVPASSKSKSISEAEGQELWQVLVELHPRPLCGQRRSKEK